MFFQVLDTIFTRIMILKTTKEIWDHLKKYNVGDERIQSMHVLWLRREFDVEKMKASDTIKEYWK